jgi:hypothetical protein
MKVKKCARLCSHFRLCVDCYCTLQLAFSHLCVFHCASWCDNVYTQQTHIYIYARIPHKCYPVGWWICILFTLRGREYTHSSYTFSHAQPLCRKLLPKRRQMCSLIFLRWGICVYTIRCFFFLSKRNKTLVCFLKRNVGWFVEKTLSSLVMS